jgi:hypothetical protein
MKLASILVFEELCNRYGNLMFGWMYVCSMWYVTTLLLSYETCARNHFANFDMYISKFNILSQLLGVCWIGININKFKF